MLDIEVATLDARELRTAGRDTLSLALMDARNHTLRWVGALSTALGGDELVLPDALHRSTALDPVRWTLGHIGWYQEYWIARNVERQRGEACDPTRTRLASILPGADLYFDPATTGAAARWLLSLPDLQTVRQYLVDTLEQTLELLHGAGEDDAGLYFYRLALLGENRLAERFAVLSQEIGFDGGLLPDVATSPPRPPLLMPATRWLFGQQPGGFVADNEKWAHEVAIPEFEIDAQPVTWSQYCEFVEDGGYDDRSHWHPDGWDWVQREGRRTPRHVDQMRQGVLQRRFGRLTRVSMAQPAVHLNAFEAEAWCRWAGRRLPTEVEWEAAAHQAASRGFAWGQVWEWTATTFRPYPGFEPGPDRSVSAAAFGTHRVLRGASFATRSALRSAKARNFAPPLQDVGFLGFRSCAL